MRKVSGTRKQSSLTLSVLSAVANGAVQIAATSIVLAAVPAPRTRRVARWQYEQFDKIGTSEIDLQKMLEDSRERRRLTRALDSLRRRRFVRHVRRGGRVYLEITEEGVQHLVPYTVQSLRVETSTVWDKKWRILLFDIPETMRVGRDALRHRLQALGFLQLQKSVFVFPYSCQDELDVLIRALRVTPYVTFFETSSLGYHEAKALAHFRLRRGEK